MLPDGRRYCSLIRPRTEWLRWDPAAQALHGVSREHAQQYGRSVETICAQLSADLRGRIVYSYAWAMDWPWISQLYEGLDRSPPFRLESVRSLLQESELPLWHPPWKRCAANWRTAAIAPAPTRCSWRYVASSSWAERVFTDRRPIPWQPLAAGF